MADDESNEPEKNIETDGRSVKIEVSGYYEVHVQGDPDDSFNDVMEKTLQGCEQATEDIRTLNDSLDDGGPSFS